MSRIVALGEIMARFATPGHLRFQQALPGPLESTFAGAEANAAMAIAHLGGQDGDHDEPRGGRVDLVLAQQRVVDLADGGNRGEPPEVIGGERGDAYPTLAECPGVGASPGLRADSAGSSLLTVGNLMGGLQARFKRVGEGACFGFAAKSHRMLVQTNLPLGLCQFFYQDLHY